MSQHDEYDRNILRALQKIGKHLESMDKKTFHFTRKGRLR